MSGHWWGWHALAYLVCLCVGMLLNHWMKQRGLYPASKHLRMVALNYNVAPRSRAATARCRAPRDARH